MSNNKSPSPDSHDSIIKATGILASGTFISRILGFIRDILLAKILGTGFQADALFVAFRIPNMFRDMIGEGASNSSFVPVISEYRVTRSREEFWRFVVSVFFAATLILCLITVLGVIFAPAVVRLLAPGFISDPEKILLTTRLTRMLFPYLIFIGLTAYTMAVLNAFRHFVTPAFSPAILNVAVIAGTLYSARYLQEPVYGIALSLLIGGALQLAFQWTPVVRTGLTWHRPKLRHPGVAQVGKLLIPRLVGSGVYQLNVLIDTFCASLSAIVGAGGIAAIYYANRLIQFPIGIFGLALASAILPALSSLAAGGNTAQLKKTLVFSLENILMAMIPASVVLVVLASPIIRVLFERGHFDAYSTAITSTALAFYALGLYSFGGSKILVTTFHSLQDTRTPVKVAAVCLVLTALLNFLLMRPMKIGGIALASTISSSVNFFLLFYLLKKKLGPLESQFRTFILKILLAGGIMAAAVWGLKAGFRYANEIIMLAVAMGGGMVVYGMCCYVLGVEQAAKVFKKMRPSTIFPPNIFR